jgi:hypothetical protein
MGKYNSDYCEKMNAKQNNHSDAVEARPQESPSTLGSIPYSLRDEAAKSAQYHQEQAVKHEKAAFFLSQHPELDEFIRLVRQGVIQF